MPVQPRDALLNSASRRCGLGLGGWVAFIATVSRRRHWSGLLEIVVAGLALAADVAHGLLQAFAAKRWRGLCGIQRLLVDLTLEVLAQGGFLRFRLLPKPGETIRFVAVSVREAREALVAREQRWSEWAAGVKFGLPAPCSMSDDMGYGWLGGEDY